MPLEYHFDCPLPNGIHARPASALEAVTRKFESEILLRNVRVGRTADSKSVLSMIGADIRLNDPCVLKIEGRDEQRALDCLSVFLRDKFPHCDDLLPTVSKSISEFQPPRILRQGVTFLPGIPIVHGIGCGTLVQANQFELPPALPLNGVVDTATELQKVETGLEQLIQWYENRGQGVKNKIEREIISSQRSMARDPEFRRVLFNAINERHRTAAGAVADAERHFSVMLEASENMLLSERILDIQGICVQLLQLIYGKAALLPEIRINTDSIIVADSLRPDQFLRLDRRYLKGLALTKGETTSHTVILARSFGVPTVTGINLRDAKFNDREAVLDGELGALVTDLNETARRYYAAEQRRLEGRQMRLKNLCKDSAATQDGQRIELSANISTADEAGVAFEAGAEGIGLFRTETLFLGRESAPEEDEQFDIYRRVLAAAGDRPVIIRTLDVGGDKPLDYLNLPLEENPFLGYRAVRIYAEFETLFRTQIRALIRASSFGQLKIMIPMIATMEEVRWIKQIVTEEQMNCANNGIPFDKTMPVGAMIETPSSVFAMNHLCDELDFFSIGSNDLLQFFLALDRTNPRVASLCNPLQPTFLRLLRQIVDTAHFKKKWIGLCGEMARQKDALPLLVGLGIDEISAAPPSLANLKSELAGLKASDCRELFKSALKCVTAEEVTGVLQKFTKYRRTPLLDPDSVIEDADALTKEEAIKQAVDRLYVLGRTENARAIEESVWQREQIYSTGFGHGFAIPHCKSLVAHSDSIVLMKLRKPVSWNSLDGQPVHTVILLVMRDGGSEHMNVFSKLARYVMREDFRDRIENLNDSASLYAFLKDKLEN